MTINDIYEDKKPLIEEAINEVIGKLFEDIDNDDEYSLSTDENTELCYKLIARYAEERFGDLFEGEE